MPKAGMICNQQVTGSSPVVGFYGRIPEWPKGADCKSVSYAFEGSKHKDFQSSALPTELSGHKLRGQDLNLRPSGYEPDELPDCSTPRQLIIYIHILYCPILSLGAVMYEADEY